MKRFFLKDEIINEKLNGTKQRKGKIQTNNISLGCVFKFFFLNIQLQIDDFRFYGIFYLV